ncbi:MAG: AhpC/TSA family protein [Prevotellaceae bacterium]|jgi:thiol-disulfide isomerase/thioredoxin|nr:AhpC/TSA family protein [Prevotellaceae bacterium]
MVKKLLILLFATALLFACSMENQNIIKGTIDGLEAGDRIVLSVEDPDASLWIAVDSAVVTKTGEFTLKTSVSDNYVRLTHLKDGEKFKKTGTETRPTFTNYFLESYATLSVTGNADDWFYLKITGGLYDFLDMQEINRITDSALVIHKEGYKMYEQSRKTDDTALQNKGVALINQAGDILISAKVLEKEFVKKYPDKAYSAGLMIYDHELKGDINKYEAAFYSLSPAVQNSPVGIYVKNYIANTRASEVGVTAPDFSQKALDGQEVTLSKFRGKYVLLDFWGSWCGPCRESSPLLVKLYKSLKEKGVNIEFIGIACNEQQDADWIAAIERDNLSWIHLNDSHAEKGKSILKQYAVFSFPTCVLVSPEGTIAYKEHPVRIIPKIKELFEKDALH